MIGKMLSHYRLVEKIGEGGMGEVYRAHDERLNRDVAIKLLPEEFARHADRLARFEREAKAIAKLTHPNILQIHELGEHEDRPFMVTELLDGETLGQCLEGGSLGWRRATEVGAAIADGLAAAHQAGIVHRDLKPSNAFLTHDGRVKILDFGLARTVEVTGVGDTRSPTVSKYTEPGAVLGTVGYMSPEQVRGEPADHRADLFALGSVLYEMITGTRAFARDTTAETMTAVLREEPPDLRTLVPDVPQALMNAVRRCLEKRPEARFQSGRDLAFVLRSVTEDESGSPARTPSEEKSILVLPFTNLSPDPEQEYFSDGLTEEIIADLAKVRSLRVISRTSAMRFKGTDKDMATIGRELNVQHVLEGSVRKAGNNLRITAQLIEAAGDKHLWTEKYSGTLDDVFDIQERVSRSIVDALELELSPETERKPAKRPIDNVHAYECYLRARQEIWRFTEAGLARALELIRRGLEHAGDNAALYAAMGTAYWQYINIGVNPAEFEHYLNKTEEYANKALELDPQSSRAYFLRGLIFNKRANQKEAVRNLRRALAIDPDDPDALYWLALIYSICGRQSAARPLAVRCLEVDPLTNFSFIVGWLDYVEGDLEAGLEAARRSYEMAPEDVGTRWVYALVLAGNKRIEELSSIVNSLEADPEALTWTASVSFLKHALLGNRDEALQVVTPELVEAFKWDEVLSWILAEGHALIDEKEEALVWLERATSRGFINYPFLSQHDPLLEDLRGEDRFKKLMEKVKYEWERFE